jgi:phage shock protein PspC (stress-responsive transcriptional regulator)
MNTTTNQNSPREPRVMRRSVGQRMIAGVAGGLAEYFDIDPTIVRIGLVALSFLGGLAIPLYLAAWLLVPEEGSEIAFADELLSQVRYH